MSGVGCSQFFASYTAYGADSIMWNVYAKRVFGLRFFSDLCSTLPWMSTRSPVGRKCTRVSALCGGRSARGRRTWLARLEDVLALRVRRGLVGWDELLEACAALRQAHEPLRDRGGAV